MDHADAIARRKGSADGALAFARAFLAFARWRAGGAALLLALGALFDGVGLLMLVPILGIVTAARGVHPAGRLMAPLTQVAAGYGATPRLAMLLAVFVALMALRALVHAARDRTLSRLQLEFVERLRLGLVEQLAAAGWQRLTQLSQPRIVQALDGEIHRVGIAANWLMLGLAALAMLVMNAALAMLLSPLAGGLGLVLATLGMLACAPYLRRARALGRAVTAANLELTGSALTFLAGLKLAIAQGLERRFVTEQRVRSAAALDDRLLFLRHQIGGRNATTALAALVGAATLLVGLGVAHLPVSVLLTLLLVLSRMNAPALIVQQAAHHLLHNLAAFDAIEELLRTLDGAASRREPDVAPAEGAIVFRGVSFRHPGGCLALAGVDLVIPAGGFVGLRGPSGSGKTTLLDLATGLLAPHMGSITVGGRPLAGPVLCSFRARLAYVTQEPFLFDGTVRANLAWARDGAGEDAMWAALAEAGAERLVRRLAHGLDTRIGERGVMLSAGERQRLALARALLRRPAVLVLDEATNAIDIAGERAILERLAAMAGAVTILLAAHRPETLALCDRVIDFPRVRGQKIQLTPIVSAVL